MRSSILLLGVFVCACGARDDFTGRPAKNACKNGSTYADCVRSDEPIGYWPLDDAPGGVAVDIGPNGLYGTLFAGVTNLQPSLIANPSTFAMAFNDGGVLLPTTSGLAFSAESSLSIELWVATTSFNTQMAFSQQRCNPDTVQLWLEGGYAGFRIATDAMKDVRAIGSTFIADGQPHHVVGVRDIDASTVSVYVDGELDSELPDTNRVTGPLAIDPTDTWIGRRSDCGGENPFFGRIDEVAAYDKALSADDARRHHDAGITTASVE